VTGLNPLHTSLALVACLACSCARAGFDGAGVGGDALDAAQPCLQIYEDGASRLVVDVTGRFVLVFDEAASWQVGEWIVTGFDPARNLAGLPGEKKLRPLQAPVGIRPADASWLILNNAISPTLDGHRLDGDDAVIDTSWTWQVTDATTSTTTQYSTAVSHRIGCDGRWQVQAEVRAAPPVDLVQYEYAMTNFSTDVTWQQSLLPDGAFRWQLAGGGASLTVRPADTPLSSPEIASDSQNNIYFTHANLSPKIRISSDKPLRLEWVNEVGWQ